METADRDDTARGNRANEDEIARLNEELRREHESLLRALADFDNFRRRVERDRLSMERAGIRAIVVKLLDVMDDFERALAHVDDGPPAIAQGVRALQRKISGILEGQGVTPFSSLGEKFDPRIHEALGVVAQADLEPGTVAEELQRGYRWGEEVLRPARVRVAQ
jgi:molecular chaperone GrpE